MTTLVRLARSSAASATAAVVVVLFVLSRAAPHEFPAGTILYGVLYGSLNGLLALGLVMLYRVTRIINFAYGAMGGVPAGIAASLYLAHGWPWGVSIALALVIGAVVGCAVGALVNWRFSRSPRLVVTVASIGLAQLLGGIALYVPRIFKGPALIASFPTSLSHLHTEINPVLFNGNDLVVVVAVPTVVALVSWFLLGTDAGRAVRAIADNPERARLVGIPARRLMLGVWTLSGVVAALAVMLAGPSQGVPLDAAAGPAILLAPLAAAVVARMESLVMAFVAGIGLGVVEEVVRLNTPKQAVEEPIFLGVILVALLVQRRSSGKVEASEESAWSVGGALRPIPAVLRSLPEVRIFRVGVIGAVVALAVALPAVLPAPRLDQVSVGVVFGIVAVSLLVLTGWAGTVSLGQMALMGVGAIVAGDLMMHLNLDMFASLVVAGAAGSVAAVVLGLPALRVRGTYLAVTTLAFAVVANDFLFNPTNFGSVIPSSVLRPVLWKRFALRGEGDLYLVCTGVLVVVILLTLGLRAGRPGRAILASRDNLRGAEAASISTVRTRLMAFTVAGAIAGVAGALYVVILGSVAYQSFQPSDSITVFSMVVIGGLTSISGSLSGVALIQWLGIEFPKLQILLSGVGLLVVLMVFPSGLAGVFQTLRDRFLIRVARRRGLDTSAWADDERDAPAVEPLPAPPTRLEGPAPDDALLTCRAVNAAYGPMQVLFGVDLDVRDGEILALLGTNGAGKSSLLRAVTGLLPASSGTITFDRRRIDAVNTESLAAAGIGMMPGGRGLFPSLTVDENLRVASWPLRHDRTAAQAARDRAAAMFPILGRRSHQLAANLSGGEQQMLSLAMAFLTRPRLLLVDELSLGLAPTVVGMLVEAVRDMHRQGTTVVVVEQSVNVALLVAERAVFLEKGQVRFAGPATDLLERTDLLRSIFVGGDGHGAVPPPAARPVVASSPNGATEKPAPVIECRGLTKTFGGMTALDAVDLTVAPGEVVGLIGHNGAGKTTLFDVVSGFLKPTGGSVWMGGEDVSDRAPWERALSGLGRSFQEARLFPSLTVAETIAVACDRHVRSHDPLAAAFRMPAATDSEAATWARVDELVERLGLQAYRNRATADLSTGTRRIVELACMVAQDPSVILLDEPSGGIAQAETEALGPMLRDLVSSSGAAMVVIEHDMNLLAGLCDRFVALDLGRLIAEGPPAEVLGHPDVIASYLGTGTEVISRSGTR